MQFIKEDIYDAAKILRCSYDELVKALSSQLKEGFSIVPLYPDMHVPQDLPPAGPLCRLNDLGRQQFPRRAGEGRIIGKGKNNPDLLRVSWEAKDGRWKVPELFHKDFVEILKH